MLPPTKQPSEINPRHAHLRALAIEIILNAASPKPAKPQLFLASGTLMPSDADKLGAEYLQACADCGMLGQPTSVQLDNGQWFVLAPVAHQHPAQPGVVSWQLVLQSLHVLPNTLRTADARRLTFAATEGHN